MGVSMPRKLLCSGMSPEAFHAKRVLYIDEETNNLNLGKGAIKPS